MYVRGLIRTLYMHRSFARRGVTAEPPLNICMSSYDECERWPLADETYTTFWADIVSQYSCDKSE